MRLHLATATSVFTLAVVLHGHRSNAASDSLGGELDALSKTCKVTLQTMLTSASDIGSCTQLADLASALISRGSDSQESVVGPVIDWESKFCATSGCQPEIIEQALHTVQSTCKTDLEKGNVIPRIAVGALKRGTLVTDLFCVADKNKKAQDYCFRKILGDLEQATYDRMRKVLSPGFLSAILANPLGYLKALGTGPWCSVCLNYLAIEAKPIMEAVASGSSKAFYSTLSDMCKGKFTEQDPPKKGAQVAFRKGDNSLPPTGTEIPKKDGSVSYRPFRHEHLVLAYLGILVEFLIVAAT